MSGCAVVLAAMLLHSHLFLDAGAWNDHWTVVLVAMLLRSHLFWTQERPGGHSPRERGTSGWAVDGGGRASANAPASAQLGTLPRPVVIPRGSVE